MADRHHSRNSHSSSHSRRHRSNSRVARQSDNSPRNNPRSDLIAYEDPYEIARYHATAQTWSWLPASLENWRTEENMHYPPHAGRNSPMDPSPFTQEAAAYTVPVLAARLHRHEGRITEAEMGIEDIRSTWGDMTSDRLGGIRSNQRDITNTMGAVHNQVISNSNAISALQTRLVQSETRTREAEEYSHTLEQRLAAAEEALGRVGRLTATLEHVATLLPPQNQPPNPRRN